MKIYQTWARNKVNTVFVAPGMHHAENSDWIVSSVVNGQVVNTPRQISVTFVKGVATVDDELGRYMIDRKLAFKSPQDEVSGVHNRLVTGDELEEYRALQAVV